MKVVMRGWINKWIRKLIHPVVMDIMLFEVRVFVDHSKLDISPKASLSNALLNTNSGRIVVGDYTFCGQNVSIITGTHDHALLGEERMLAIADQGQDIIIGNGVWVGSNAVILGPCVIGDNAVIAAGAVVTKNVDANTIVAGVPARRISAIPVAVP